MTNWEHRSVVTNAGDPLNTTLERESRDGWELVSAVAAKHEYQNTHSASEAVYLKSSYTVQYRLFFKRPK
jgi:hypothetical protein